MIRKATLLAGITAFATLSMTAPVAGQTLQSLETADTPLTLKSRGSFYVGGQSVEQTAADLGGINGPDTATINQMYVDYMVPMAASKVPVVMIHGASLSGKSYDTTPDGRIGWYEYFVRRAHPTFVVDQVGRARSGFDGGQLNRRLATGAPSAGSGQRLEAFRFGARTGVWTNFRFGPRPGVAFPDSKFPTEAAGELAKQEVPEMRALLPTPNPNFQALTDLANGLGGAVLISHSQSGHYPMEAALRSPNGVRGIIAIEPGTCGNAQFSDTQIAQLAKVPVLVLFGDNLSSPPGYGTQTWQDRYDGCVTYAQRLKAAGGRAEVVKSADLGIRGNSHMIMLDRNNLTIADHILAWIDRNVPPQTGAAPAQASQTADAGRATPKTSGRVWRKGSPPFSTGPADNFTGTVRISSPYRQTGRSRLGGSTVHFERGARTAWHSHPIGQTLIVIEGCGWTQRESSPIEKICAGDVATVAPGEKHWHGGTDTSAMTHVTASETVEGEKVQWLAQVSDAEYARGPK